MAITASSGACRYDYRQPAKGCAVVVRERGPWRRLRAAIQCERRRRATGRTDGARLDEVLRQSIMLECVKGDRAVNRLLTILFVVARKPRPPLGFLFSTAANIRASHGQKL